MPTPIPAEQHVARHCRNRHIIKDSEGRPISVFGDAFALRENETYVSTGWVEFFSGTWLNQLSQVRNAMATAREIKRKDGLAVMEVGKIVEAGRTRSVRIRVLHEPKKENPAYAAIRGIPRDHQELLEALATEAVVELVISEALP
jgi:hypothetical protein